MPWPTDMDTARMQATINQQAERIHQLKDQVTRLQVAFTNYVANNAIEVHHPNDVRDSYVPGRYGLRPGDLDPIE